MERLYVSTRKPSNWHENSSPKERCDAKICTSLIKVSISQFRQACVTIQRFWRAKNFKKVAEMALLLKYWDARKQQLAQG